MQHSLKDRCKGRWRDILLNIGISEKFLKNKHGACPLCGGKDRYRWSDSNGNGSYFCNQCGSGSGIELVSKFLKVDYATAWRETEKHLNGARFVISDNRGKNFMQKQADKIWNKSLPIQHGDAVSLYLEKRGVKMKKYPVLLRCNPNSIYWHKDKTKSFHPAMVARFLSPDGKETATHITYLTHNGEKAKVGTVRKVKGKLPKGGAVRLDYSAQTMGIAEGIETALSASILYDIPVWSTLNAGELVKWQPPKNVEHVIIFGDNDFSYTGQAMSYNLAKRLRSVNKINAEVRLPDFQGDDWNDVHTRGVV